MRETSKLIAEMINIKDTSVKILVIFSSFVLFLFHSNNYIIVYTEGPT